MLRTLADVVMARAIRPIWSLAQQASAMPGTKPSENEISAARVAVRHGERAVRCHIGAAQRIDSALYELDQLRAELAAVLPPEVLARIMAVRDPPTATTPLASPALPHHLPSGNPKPESGEGRTDIRAGQAARARSAA